MMKWKFFVIFLLQLHKSLTRVLVFPADTFEECDGSEKATYIDFSGLEHEYLNDTEFYLNG